MELNSWSDYKKFVDQAIRDKKEYFYRGHPHENWKLQTSFHREGSIAGITLSEYFNLLIPGVHYYVSAWRNEIINLQVSEEFGAFLALLQHHGFPTPMLDWTSSPYVAVYFAYKDVHRIQPQTDNVVVYIFDYVAWLEHFGKHINLREEKNPYVTVLFPFAKFNMRLIQQRGAYTATNVNDMEDFINQKSKELGHQFLYRAKFPMKERSEIMRELHMMGITEMALFPGIEGICQTMKDQYFTSNKSGLTPDQKKLLSELLKNGPTAKD